MATPWWLETRWVPVFYDTAQGAAPEQYDVRTGQKVYQQDGQYFYTLPSGGELAYYDVGNAMQAYSTPSIPGVPVADQNAVMPTVKFVTGQGPYGNAPYGNLGGEVGVVDGKPAYLFPMSRGATPEGDIGTYGGAQRVTWNSPSGAKGQVVRGPDGELWVAAPPDAQFGEADVADHSTVLGDLQKTYGPFISAALMAPGVDIATGAAVPSLGSKLASSLGLGGIGGSAALGGLQSFVQGGDPLTGAAKGAIGGAASELGGPILKDAGLSPEASKAILGAGTAALTGGNPLLAGLSGLSPALTSTSGEITGPMAETPVMGSEGGGYPGAEFDAEQAPQEAEFGAEISAPETPQMPPLEYTAPETGVKIPEKLLSAALGIGQQRVPTGTAASPTGTQTQRLGSPEIGASSLAALGRATSPDQAVGAGELESTRTGKKRRNVWNVASLKNLQDALGV